MIRIGRLERAMEKLNMIDKLRQEVEVQLAGEPEWEKTLFPLVDQIYTATHELELIIVEKLMEGRR